MADCTPKTLLAGAECLECALTHKQLLAALVYVQCTANSMNCSPSSLLAGANCIMCLTEKQLIAALVYIQCTNNGGGGGGGGGGTGVTCGAYGSGQPSFTPSTSCGSAIDTDTGNLWFYYGGAWHFALTL